VADDVAQGCHARPRSLVLYAFNNSSASPLFRDNRYIPEGQEVAMSNDCARQVGCRGWALGGRGVARSAGSVVVAKRDKGM
jgi:hypothetical protein